MHGWTQRRVPRRTVRALVRAWLAAVAATLIAFAGVTAHGAWRAVVGDAPARRIVRPVSPAIPIAAAFPTGVAATVAPPPPIPLAATGPAAAPLTLAGRPAIDRARAMECLTAAIYYEAGSEPDAGQRAVAQVVLNRVRHPAFPASVCGVVYQGSARSGCQFSFACDGALARVPSPAGWARAARVAAAALAGRVYAPVGLATHYHTFAVTPAWSRALVMTDAEGAHFFHRWKGWLGTAAAFRQRYAGGEPVPGPPVPVAAVAPLAAAPPMPAATRTLPPAATPAPVVADRRLEESGEVLDRWKDAGQPVRQP